MDYGFKYFLSSNMFDNGGFGKCMFHLSDPSSLSNYQKLLEDSKYFSFLATEKEILILISLLFPSPGIKNILSQMS